MEPKQHPFSWQALTRITLMALILLLAWKALGILVVILISLMIAAALYPIAKRMSKKIPKIIAIMVAIIFLLVPLIILITITSFAFTRQFSEVLTVLMPLLEKFHLTPAIIQNINLMTYIRSNLGTFLTSTKQAALGVAAVLTVIFLTFYFMFDAERLFTLFIELFPKKERQNIQGLSEEIGRVTGQYIRGNLFISLICIIIIYGGLALLKVPFALPLAIFTGVMDLLPVIGPVLGALPALVLGFAISPLTGFLVLLLYIVYKEVEDVIIDPLIYNQALNLSPALVFLSVVIGAGVFGVLGAFLALPVAASIPVIIRYREHFLNGQK